MRSRHVVLLSLTAVAGIVAGCGGGSVAYKLPKTVPALTAPPSGGTPAADATAATSTTSTTSTTATTAAPTTSDPAASGGTAATPAAPVTTTPAATGGTATPTQTTDAGGTTGGTTTNSGGAGGTDFDAFCQENPGAC